MPHRPAFVISLLIAAPTLAQTAGRICVTDAARRPIADAKISAGASLLGKTDDGGCLATALPIGASVAVSAPGFASQPAVLQTPTTTIQLQPQSVDEQVTVTAARTPLALDASANDIAVLSSAQVQNAPGFALDDSLRQVPGFQLYRRTSSWAANPTSQGLSLRGLGSTAASRTLVVSDEVPWNDPGGGWVRWNEIPLLDVSQVEIVRGGASDLYGSSAIGGVIQIIPIKPEENSYALDTYAGMLGTYSLNALATLSQTRWHELAAFSQFHTNGYIPVPEPYRGTADADADDHSQSGRVELHYDLPERGSVFLRGNVLDDARQNGTVLQNNAARVWRYATGGDWADNAVGSLRLRLYGTDEGYRQSFSSVSADRDSEKLTKLQRFPIQELGGSAQWARSYSRAFTLVAGADTRDIRGNDREVPVSGGILGPGVSTSARQRATGAYSEALWLPHGWSFALSGRVDRFSTFDASKLTQGSSMRTPLPSIGETVFNPRLGVVRNLGEHVSLNASVFRAFRGPTLNELYRNSQVGNELQLANPNLRSERATGYEFGTLLNADRAGSLRASWFWTEVNRPITSLIIDQTPTSITEMRENLGQLRSRGIAVEYFVSPFSWMRLQSGYQYADATVTQFAPQPSLIGSWIPQVPRNTSSSTLSLHSYRLGHLDMFAYLSGRAYDDSGNQFLLHSYARFDLHYAHAIRGKWSAYADVQNLLDRSIEVARTPVLSLGTPQTLTVGVLRTSRPAE